MDTNQTTVIAEAGPEDMLATIWFRMGYKPRDSLLLLGLEGPRQRAGVLIRADLPNPNLSVDAQPGTSSADPPRPVDQLSAEELRTVLPEMVSDLLATIAASAARGVIAFVATESALDRRPPPVLRVLRREVPRFGLKLTDVIGVTSTVFRSLRCRDPRCCSPSGRSIDLVLSSRTAAVHVLNGDLLLESEADLIRDVVAGPEDSPRSRPFAPPPEGEAVQRRWQWWDRWDRACRDARGNLDRVEPLPGFSAALHDPLLRDAVLFSQFGADLDKVRGLLDDTPPAAPDRSGRLEPTPADRGRDGGGFQDLDRLLRRCPEVDRISPGQAVLAGAVRVAGAGDRAPALAVLAMLAWFQGRGGRARLLLEQARADSSTVSLTGLVEDLVTGQVPPPWWRNGPEG